MFLMMTIKIPPSTFTLGCPIWAARWMRRAGVPVRLHYQMELALFPALFFLAVPHYAIMFAFKPEHLPVMMLWLSARYIRAADNARR